MTTGADDVVIQPGSSTEITAIAHLYRGEIHRAALWRSRLDTTTNWAVVTTGIALSVAFSSPETTAIPIVLVSLLLLVFLVFESRRYLYFDVTITRVRALEALFFSPLLSGRPPGRAAQWREVLAQDYVEPRFHISFLGAVRHRLRRNYALIFGVQIISYWAKVAVHPGPLQTFDQLLDRVAVGPLQGGAVLGIGFAFYGSLFLLAIAPGRWVESLTPGRRAVSEADRMSMLAVNEPH